MNILRYYIKNKKNNNIKNLSNNYSKKYYLDLDERPRITVTTEGKCVQYGLGCSGHIINLE